MDEDEFERLLLKTVEHQLEIVGGRDYRGAEWSVTCYCRRCGRRRIEFDEVTQSALAGERALGYFAYPQYDDARTETGYRGHLCGLCLELEDVDWVREGF